MPTLALFSELAVIALIFAGIPVAYLWKKPGYSFFQKLNWLLVFMTFDLIIFGAFTRLSDSGLGCPDWPGCYGSSNPWHAIGDIQLAETSMPSGPVTLLKAWIEMIHRYLAMTVGTLIIVQVIMAWTKVKSFGKWSLIASLGLLVLVCVQGAFGAWTVTLKLQPIIVSTHLMLALCLLACLTLYAQQNWSSPSSVIVPLRQKPLSAWLVSFALVVLAMQIFLGAWVSTNYAVLACPDFPLCNGAWWPDANWHEGFTFWRELGKNAMGDYISPEALQTIHWAHRLFAMVAILALATLALSVHSVSKTAQPELYRLGSLLIALLLLQLVTGISNVVFQWPLLAALLHTAGAAGLVFCLVRLSSWASWKTAIQIKMPKRS
ncbi:COX15/CtaA family protein [Polynucleobacter paludilacus]|uniref:COX15/CtaA family protein n=1 Tax=Polynucleobacter paludilacus TaxID=1855895 RepID=UPI001BFE29DB|nr:COX15/CtaA family protein [Polynucleobacter paludilacus]QWD86884.1 COX15/CtaA family protein [Polynucleobacter paludilacus]